MWDYIFWNEFHEISIPIELIRIRYCKKKITIYINKGVMISSMV
jgi:hypothetical protein